MRGSSIPFRAFVLAAVSTSAAAASLRPRADDTCAVGFDQCSQAGIPSNFCCETGTTCNILARNTTVVCCPTGADCNNLSPITCDLSLQDAEAHPDAPIKTTALGGTLAPCGGSCCPFGYSCLSSKCKRNDNQNAAPIQSTGPGATTSSAAPSATASATTNPGNALTSTTGAAQSPEPAAAEDGSNNFPVASVVGGILGAVAVIAIAILVFCLVRRKKKRAAETYFNNKSSSSFGHIIGNPVTISSPKMASEGRTDFIRKSPLSTPASASGDSGRFPPGSGYSIGNADTKGARAGGLPATPSPTRYARPRSGGVGIAPIRQMRAAPVTPRAQREPSMEIDVWAAASTVGRSGRRDSDDRKTTFTELMEAADLGDVGRGGRFVPATPSLQGSPMARR